MINEDKKYASGAGILIVSLMLSNLLNFLYNAYLGRALSFDDYGVITLIGNLWLILSIVINALGATVNHHVAFVSGKSGIASTIKFFRFTLRRSLFFSLIFSAIWLISTPLLASFFNLNDIKILIYFTPAIILGVLFAVSKGFLQGNLFFFLFAVATLSETISKFIFSVLFVSFNHPELAYLSVPLSFVVALILSLIFVIPKARSKDHIENKAQFPTKFMYAAILNGITSAAFLTVDVLLAKHYLNSTDSGKYALLSLVGKMIYFFGSMLSTLMITVISRSDGEHKNTKSYFYKFLTVTAFFSLSGFVVLGPLGKIIVPILFGDKAKDIFPYLTTYTLAITLFTLSNTVIVYHLAKKHYSFSFVGVLFSICMAIGIFLFHNTVFQIVYVVLATAFASFVIIFMMHFVHGQGRFLLRNLIDFFDLFMPIDNSVKTPRNAAGKKQDRKKKILIFNWRDTKHKYAGGAEVYVHELAKRWAKDGNKVTLFCGNDSTCKRFEIIDGVEIVRRGGFYFVYVWAFFYYLFKFRGKYDVIIDCQNGIPFFTPLYAKERIFCVMHHVHQEVFRESLIKPLAIFAMSLEKKVMPWAYRNIQFIAVSKSTKDAMQDLGLTGKGIEIIHNGVDLSKLFPGEKFKDPTILYLGRLKAYKSIDILINSFTEILNKIPNALLIIAGSGEEESSLKKLVTKLDLQDHVIFKGKVTEKDKLELLQKAWVFVNPSKMEGWGITTIEANACGTPVVASNVPGLKDSVDDKNTGMLVEYGNEKEFAKIIVNLLKKNQERESMGMNAIKWAQSFDWRKSANKLFSLIF